MNKKKIDFDFNKLDQGGKIMFVSSCVALFSFILPWVDIGLIARNGLSQGTFLLFGLYVYPMWKLLYKERMDRRIALACAGAAVVFDLIYIMGRRIEWFDQVINAAASGSYLFLFASVGLGVGIWKFDK